MPTYKVVKFYLYYKSLRSQWKVFTMYLKLKNQKSVKIKITFDHCENTKVLTNIPKAIEVPTNLTENTTEKVEK